MLLAFAVHHLCVPPYLIVLECFDKRECGVGGQQDIPLLLPSVLDDEKPYGNIVQYDILLEIEALVFSAGLGVVTC